MVAPQSSDIKTIIVTGIEKIHELHKHEEQQFVQALQKGRVKLTLDNGTILSIRPTKETPQKLNTINDLLKQIQEHSVIFAVSTDEKKEYFFSNLDQQSAFENKLSKNGKQKIFTLLDDETKSAIDIRIMDLLEGAPDNVTEHKESKKEVAAATAAKPAVTASKTAPTEVPETEKTEAISTVTVNTSVMDAGQKTEDSADAEEAHLKQDAERQKEMQAAEKKQIIEETEEKRQELRVKQQTDTDQAGDKGSFNEELLKPASSNEIKSETPTKSDEAL